MQGNVNIPDSTITTNLSFRQLVLMNMQQLTNFPYIENDFDALTDYELLCLVVKFLNDVIANQNEQNDSITRMYESFLALQDYVNNTKDTLEDAFNELDDYVRNYFDNLDVQEEINNKLDQMLEDGVLEQIIEQFIQSTALWCFDNVASMKQATNLINGSYAKTLGFYSISDCGESTYKIRTKTNEDVIDEKSIISLLDENLIAELVLKDEMYVEQFGAYGDNTHDDYDSFELAISTCSKVICNNKTYKIDSQLTLTSDKELCGVSSTLGKSILNIPDGVKLAGQRLTIKNITIQGDTTGTYGLYCCGRNDGGSSQGDNHFNQNVIENMIVNDYTNGIYFSGVIWNNVFNNIRINRCSYGLLNTSTYYIMTTEFNNIYFSGITTCDVSLYKTNAIFNYCNFGISANRCLLFQQNCNVKVNSSNFECDKYIEGAGTLFEISGYNLSFDNCEFKICTANTVNMFFTGGAVKDLSFKDCIYTSVNLTSDNAMGKILSSDITGFKYGIINDLGGNNIPFNLSGTYRIPYGKFPFVRLNNMIQAYSASDVSDLTKLNAGELVYLNQSNTINYYNGTQLVEL